MVLMRKNFIYMAASFFSTLSDYEKKRSMAGLLSTPFVTLGFLYFRVHLAHRKIFLRFGPSNVGLPPPY